MNEKVVRVGRLPEGDIFCKITFKDGKLSISGVVGPRRDGNCNGDCGQIRMSFKEYDHRGHRTLEDIALQDNGWTKEMVKKFFDIWDRWHLNDMRAGSPAQEAYLRAHPVQYEYPTSHYAAACKALDEAGLNPDQNYMVSQGNKSTQKAELVPCTYGQQWLFEAVPTKVIDFLVSLPETDKTPAWV